MSRAIGLADPELERFRRELIDELAAEHGFDPSRARRAARGASSSRPARSRSTSAAAPACWSASWPGSSAASSGRPPALEPPCPDPADRRAALALAERLEPEDVFVLADRCLEADYHLQRNLYMPLVLESLFHDLARLINPRARD